MSTLEIATDPNAPVPRSRGLTTQLRQATPAWVLAVALLGGGGGIGAVGAGALDDDDTGERVSLVEHDQQEHGRRLDDLDRGLSANAARLAIVELDAAAAERRMLRWQVALLRWMADVLAKQSKALGQIAAHQGVDVDVDLPQLPPDVLETVPQ